MTAARLAYELPRTHLNRERRMAEALSERVKEVGEPGIVLFGKSMHVTYINERARHIIDCTRDPSRSAIPRHDLMYQIVKLVARTRERLVLTVRDGSSAQMTEQIMVSTVSGLFRVKAFPVPSGPSEGSERIMVMVHKCQSQRHVPGTLVQSRTSSEATTGECARSQGTETPTLPGT